MHNIKELHFFKNGKLSAIHNCIGQSLADIKIIIAVNESIGRTVKIIYTEEGKDNG